MKIHGKKQNNSVISFFILLKNWQLVTLLFQKRRGKNKSQICDFSRYFSRKGKKLVANATGLVTISSPVADVDRMTGIKVATFRLRRPRINLNSNNDIDNNRAVFK